MAPSGTAATGPDETWTLSVDVATTVSIQGAAMTSTAKGTATLTIDPQRKVTGTGQMTVKEVHTHPMGLRTELSGSGGFRVVGRRDGGYLVFSFEGTIPLTGTSSVPQLGTIPADGHFDTASIAFQQRIERTEGATAAARTTAAAGAQADIQSGFRLSGGRNLAAEPAAPSDTFPARPNPWTLELAFEQDQVVRLGDIHQTITLRLAGTLQFPLPRADGPATGSGKLNGWMTVARHSPQPGSFREDLTGTLYLDGTVSEGVLAFVPRADLGRAAATDSAGVDVRYSNPAGAGIFTGDETVRITVRNGAETVLAPPLSAPGVTGSSKITWRLRGKERQLWKVVVDSRHLAFTNFLGSSALSAGLWARVLTEFDVELEDGKVVGGKGTRRLVSVTPHSDPPGVWSVVSAKIQVQHAISPWLRHKAISQVGGWVRAGNILAVDVPTSDMGLAWTITLDETAAAARFSDWTAIRHRFTKRFTNSDTFGLPSYWEFPLVSPVTKVIRDEATYRETLRAHRVH